MSQAAGGGTYQMARVLNVGILTLSDKGSRGEREDSAHAERLSETRQLQIVGAEVVSPFTDTMGLVDGQHSDLLPA